MQVAESEKPAERTHRRMGLVCHGDGAVEQEGGKMFLHGQQRKGAGTDKGTDKSGVSEHYGGNLFPTLQAGIQRRGQPRHHRGHKQGGSGPAVDRHDGTEAGEMDLHALGRTENPLPYGNHRSRVRLLRRHGGKGAGMVAETQPGMAVPAAERAETDVETIHHRKHAVSVECGEADDEKAINGLKKH